MEKIKTKVIIVFEVKKMNQYVTGSVIKELREKNKLTQLQLADKLGVSDKTVSKWERNQYVTGAVMKRGHRGRLA